MKTRRILEEKNIRKITKTSSGSSYSITLPIDVVRRWGWKERQKVQLMVNDKKREITIKDWKSSK